MNCQLLHSHSIINEDFSLSNSLWSATSANSPVKCNLIFYSLASCCNGHFLRQKFSKQNKAKFSIELRFLKNKEVASGSESLNDRIVVRSTGQNGSQVTSQDNEEVIIDIRKGDALVNLAERFDCSVDDWLEANKNDIIDPFLIYEGQELKVPPTVCYRGTIPPEYADRVKIIPKTTEPSSESSVFSSMLSKLHVIEASEIAKAKASIALDELQKKKTEFTTTVFSSPVIGSLGLGGKSGLEARGGNPYRAGLVIALGFALLTAALVSIWKKEKEIDTQPSFPPSPPSPPPEPVYSPPVPVPVVPVPVSVSNELYWGTETSIDKAPEKSTDVQTIADSASVQETESDKKFHFQDQIEAVESPDPIVTVLEKETETQIEIETETELPVVEDERVLESNVDLEGDVAVRVSSDVEELITVNGEDLDSTKEGLELSEEFSSFVITNEVETVLIEEEKEEVSVIVSEREIDVMDALEKEKEKGMEENAAMLIKSAIPTVAVSAGAFAFMTGGFQGGLEVIGLTALTSFVTLDLLWAEERVKLWNEVKDIRSHEKFVEFLRMKKILPEDD